MLACSSREFGFHTVVGYIESSNGALECRVDLTTRPVGEVDEPLEGEVRIDLVILVDRRDNEVEQAVLDPGGNVESLREVSGPRRQDLCTDFDWAASARRRLVGEPSHVSQIVGHDAGVALGVVVLEVVRAEGELKLQAVDVVLGQVLLDVGEPLGAHLGVHPVEGMSSRCR